MSDMQLHDQSGWPDRFTVLGVKAINESSVKGFGVIESGRSRRAALCSARDCSVAANRLRPSRSATGASVHLP
jgi:hypothetical protein